MKSRLITIKHDGFHGTHSVTLRVRGEPGEWYTLTDSQTRKLQYIACGMDDCRCGETLLRTCDIAGSDNLTGAPIYRLQVPDIEEDTLEVSGNYPQGN